MSQPTEYIPMFTSDNTANSWIWVWINQSHRVQNRLVRILPITPYKLQPGSFFLKTHGCQKIGQTRLYKTWTKLWALCLSGYPLSQLFHCPASQFCIKIQLKIVFSIYLVSFYQSKFSAYWHSSHWHQYLHLNHVYCHIILYTPIFQYDIYVLIFDVLEHPPPQLCIK